MAVTLTSSNTLRTIELDTLFIVTFTTNPNDWCSGWSSGIILCDLAVHIGHVGGEKKQLWVCKMHITQVELCGTVTVRKSTHIGWYVVKFQTETYRTKILWWEYTLTEYCLCRWQTLLTNHSALYGLVQCKLALLNWKTTDFAMSLQKKVECNNAIVFVSACPVLLQGHYKQNNNKNNILGCKDHCMN